MKTMTRARCSTALVLISVCAGGCDRLLSLSRPNAKSVPAHREARPQREALSESYTSKNGLITVHYPSSFAAKTVGKNVVLLARNLNDGLDEVVTFVPIEKPISDELPEFARVIAKAEEGALAGYAVTSSGPATCNGQTAAAKTGTWGKNAPYFRRACYFLHNGHGYSVAYMVPQSHAAEETAMLVQIAEGMQFNR
jgi:hypothetical protein